MKRHPKDQAVILQLTVDELVKLHGRMADLREEIADAYTTSANDLEIKPATLKKLVKQLISPEEPEDPQLAQLMEMLNPAEAE